MYNIIGDFMKYKNILKAKFIKRENRFISYCLIDNKEVKVYVPNTGRCKELLYKGVDVILSYNNNPKRTTKYTLLSVYKESRLINIDSQAPNTIVFEALENNKIFKDINFTKLIREKTFKNSRFDIYYEGYRNKKFVKGFIEVKGVTLEVDNVAYFPDAPTLRGLKHIKELIDCLNCGYEANIIFLIQMENINYFLPNASMQAEFAAELNNAQTKGIKILSYESQVKKDEIYLNKKVPIGDLSKF